MSQKKTLPPPEFPQANSDGKINIPDIKAMLTKYVIMRVNKYQSIEEIDTIEGEIHLKNEKDTKANVKSIPYTVAPDQINYDFYTVLFDVDKIDISGLCETSYTMTNLHQEILYSQTANITIIGETNMPNPDNEIIFLDAKNSILYLTKINMKKGTRVRAKFDDLAEDDDIIFTAKFFGDSGELFIIKSINITLRVDDINNGYLDYIFDKNKINFSEVKSVIVKFSTPDDKIKSNYEDISIKNDLDTVNIKVQTTKNIADLDSDHPDIKPSLIAVVYTHLDNKPIMAHVTNALFGNNDLNTTLLNDINKDGVAYLHIYSKDSSKNSILTRVRA
ncbi:hypothetical protein [Xenorhabdus thailandensis]|uniref:hypothetical protein n=1 Tax=Xenorhabdus thailandensis TaxID=3136255 RepID=UPI0030F3BF97